MLLPPEPAPLSVSAVVNAIVPTAELLWNWRKRRETRPAPAFTLCAPRVLVSEPLICSVLFTVMSGRNVASPRLV